MRVLMFGWEFPPHISGGLGTACYGLVKGLLNHGVNVLFVVPKAYGDEDGSVARILGASDIPVDVRDKKYTEFWENFSYMEVNSKLIPYVSLEEYYQLLESSSSSVGESEESLYTRRFNFSGSYGPNLLEEVEKYALIASFNAEQNPHDIIHAHDWLTYKAGIAAKRVSGKPLVVHIHATEFDRSGENVNQLVYDIERAGMEAADLVVAVSELTRNIVINRYGIPPSKVVTVHNGVIPLDHDLDGVSRHLREKIVTFLGRITFQKGPDYFVEAARKVLDKDSNVRFVMAGSGDMLNKMIRRVAALKMGARFHFTGFLKGEEVNRMFALSDVYVMPSVSEPFGISPLEAMRSNVPVVISKQSGVSEVLHHALKVDFWDIDALADSIYGLLNYPALSNMFIKYGKREVENLKWDNAAHKVKEAYSSLLP
ncbi:MAG TPA: glycosyltransferase family 4 protein [Bacteroidales bacterium]|nr:glycosyltransferase family 4 protein [Bacteroidales bacterium]